MRQKNLFLKHSIKKKLKLSEKDDFDDFIVKI